VGAVGTKSVEAFDGSGRDPDHVPGGGLACGGGVDDPEAVDGEVGLELISRYKCWRFFFSLTLSILRNRLC
jgi:hypothetical protein